MFKEIKNWFIEAYNEPSELEKAWQRGVENYEKKRQEYFKSLENMTEKELLIEICKNIYNK